MLDIKKLLIEILSHLRHLPNYYRPEGGQGNRPASANINSDNSGSVINFLSTSSMTTGRPSGDGNILHFNWDNSNKWASQLFLKHSSGNGVIQHRTQSLDSGTSWTEWHDVYYAPEAISDSANLNSYKTPGDFYCSSDSKASGLSNCPVTQAFWLYVRNAVAPHSLDGDTYKYRTQTIITRNGQKYTRSCQTGDGGTNWTWTDWGHGNPYVANNLTTSSAGYVLDARQGKVLNDNKFAKTGGSVTGNITVDKTDTTEASSAQVKVIGSQGANQISLLANNHNNNTAGLYDGANSRWVLEYDTSANTTKINKLTFSDTATATAASSISSFSYKTCKLYKIGNIVFMEMMLQTASSTIPADNATLFTIPSGYRPSSQINVACYIGRSATAVSFSGTCRITTGGLVSQNNSTIGTSLYCFAVWSTV